MVADNLTEKSANEQTSDLGPALNTSSAGLIWFGVFAMIFLFGVGGAWAYFTNISGAVIGQGQVIVRGQAKSVQHLDGGIVKSVFVENGSRVETGDQLLALDDTLLSANLEIYSTRLQEALSQRDRLRAERDEALDIVWDDTLWDLLQLPPAEPLRKAQERLMETRRASREGEVEKLQEQVAQFAQQLLGLEAQIKSREAQLGFITEELEGVRSLFDQGLASNARMLSLEREREDINANIASSRSEIARIRNAIAEREVQVLQIGRSFQEQVLTELREREQVINELVQQYQASREQKKRVLITAPVSGIIHEMDNLIGGSVIAPGDPIMQVVPGLEDFEVEVSIEPQFIDEIFPGQDAVIRFSAFSQRTIPDIFAAVRDISPSVVIDQQSGMSFYKVWLTVSAAEMEKLGERRLVAGMPAEVFLQTTERTPISYLMKPLTEQFARAFREE